jgi:type IV secretory pathway VirB4 component
MHQLSLGSIDGKPFHVDANLIATGRTCVLGSSGSGKSYAVGVICEELCKNHVPFVIIDTEGEYSGLKEKYDVIWVGEDQHCDLNWKSLNLEKLAQHALDSAPLILDLSETVQPRKKISAFLSEIYREVSKRRTPYLVILEEADKFAPQVGERLQISIDP